MIIPFPDVKPLSPIFSPEDCSDNTIRELVRALSVAQDGSVIRMDATALTSSWRDIKANSVMLHRVLNGFRSLYEGLLGQTDISFNSDEDISIALLRRAESLQYKVKNVGDIWRALIWFERKYCALINDTSALRNDAKQGRAIAEGLAKTIAWLNLVIAQLSRSYARVQEARVARTPIFRLHLPILTSILEFAADYDPPTEKSLGWVGHSHVCSVWREILMGMPRLWARDAFAFGTEVAAKELLDRADQALVSISRDGLSIRDSTGPSLTWHEGAVSFARHDQLSSLYLLSINGNILDVKLLASCCTLPEMSHIFRRKALPHLRDVCIKTPWTGRDETGGLQQTMAPHPNLQRLEFLNTFIPFGALPSLVSLHLVSEEKNKNMPEATLNALLDSLERCPTLRDLRIYPWTIPLPSPARTPIALPYLDTLYATSSRLLDHLHLPALRRLRMLTPNKAPDLRAALQALFERYTLPLRTMHLSQRVLEGDEDLLTIRFGFDSSISPRPEAIPVSFDFGAIEPGQDFVELMMKVQKNRSAWTLSRLFRWTCSHVREIVGTEALQVLGFDNETRDASFRLDPTDGRVHLDTMVLPSFPSVRRFELPMREGHLDSTYHALQSLTRKTNPQHLPLLQRIKFAGPVLVAQKFGELHKAVVCLLHSRRSVDGISTIKTLEFELALGVCAEAYPLETLKMAVSNAVRCALGEGGAMNVEEVSPQMRDGTSSDEIRIVATLVYPSSTPAAAA
ncbi:unnamed protein product [Peniophora sp. CBMAI 1063]|nr:unnamed protein product [Peniophora sp. CBMAI 1063]